MIRKISKYHILSGIIIAIIVVIVVIAAMMVSRNWQYNGYRVLRSEKQEDTISTAYANLGDYILQYSSDVARLQDRQGSEIWSVHYKIQNPVKNQCGNTLLLYDRSGTDVVVIDRDGKKNAFTTKLPIVKACVTENGNVAAVQEDESNAWIEYYDKSGKEIASIKTSMDNPGYPLDISISPGGELLAVSYLTFTQGIQQGLVYVYSFGQTGQNQMDNRIAAFTYDQKLVPELTFLNDRTLVAFRDNGISIYEGAKVPKVAREITTDREICSVFYDEDHIGMLLLGDTADTYRMELYNRNGGEVLTQEVDFPFTHVELHGSEVSLYNGAALRVYSLHGTLKYDGAYTSDPRYFFAIGKHRYVAVTDNAFELLQLR